MGICHPKPSPPKTPFDDDDDDDAPPECVTEVRGPSRQDVIDEHHHRRLLVTATAAATLTAEGGCHDPATSGGPTPAATALVEGVRAIATARGRTNPCVRLGGLPSALPEVRALFLAGDAVGKVADAVLDMLTC